MISRRVSKYTSVYKIQLSNRLAYAGDLALQSLSIVIFLWIFFQLWRVTYTAAAGTGGAGGGTIEGLTLNDTMWYLMLAEAIILSRANAWRAISEAVKDGSIAYLLNKPYNFLLYQASISFADSTARLGFNLLAGSAIVWMLAGPPPSPGGWALALAAIPMAWGIEFCFSALIGLAAFVTEEVNSFDLIYSKFMLVLGGVLIPLDFFPLWLQRVTQALPFAYIIYGPARLSVDPTLERFTSLIQIQAFWLAALLVLLAFIYRRSVGWLNINGG